MLRLDIIGILMTLFLVNILSAKRVILAQLLISVISITILLFANVPFIVYTLGGIFSYAQVNNGILEVLNFIPLVIGVILSRYVKSNASVTYTFLLPWEHSSSWNVIFYKLAFYNLFFQLVRIILRG